jgi:hypothetical protein
MDSLVLEDSINSDFKSSDFLSKKWLYVNDSNSSNYQSMVVINSQSLANSGQYINYQEAFLAIPLVITCATLDGSNFPNNVPIDYFVGMKSGFWHILDSIIVELNNGNVVQQTPLTNVFCGFKALSSWSKTDVEVNGQSAGFYPDTSDAWCFNNDAVNENTYRSFCGQGISNNVNAQFYSPIDTLGDAPTDGSAISANPGSTYNKGLWTRQQWISYDAQFNVADKGQSKLLDAQNANNIFKPYIERVDGAQIIRLVAKIRLKDVCDFFKSVPLMKGGAFTIKLITNQCTSQVSIDENGVMALVQQNLQGNTNPLQLASTRAFCGGSLLPSEKTYCVNVSIFKNVSQKPAPTVKGWDATTTLTSCRLYAPAYQFNALSEQRYLSLVPTKKVIYRDIFGFQFDGIRGGDNFNFLVSNGLTNLRSVVVIPVLSARSNGKDQEPTNVSSIRSPFSSTGATPDPIALSNVNFQISGRNLFENNTLYDFETWKEQLSSANSLNGNLTTGITSGLISEYDFSAGVRYYYGNTERSLPSEDGVQRSVQVLGKVECPNNIYINLLVFCEQEKSMTIDVRSGFRID